MGGCTWVGCVGSDPPRHVKHRHDGLGILGAEGNVDSGHKPREDPFVQHPGEGIAGGPNLGLGLVSRAHVLGILWVADGGEHIGQVVSVLQLEE